jgi:pyridoxine 5-phosphate synthase
MVALSVNINKIALIRNSREGNYPDLLDHAKKCVDFGAAGITVHPRPDQRHIRAADIPLLQTWLNGLPDVEFNIEGNPFAAAEKDYPGFIDLVIASTPDQCTLVPDTTEQLTSDHGFDLKQQGEQLAPLIAKLKEKNIRVSLFMDPDPEQIRIAASIGADRIELYTGPFAASYQQNPDSIETQQLFSKHCKAAELARELDLGVNAGHDLNLHNLTLYKQLPFLEEVSIGHALTVDAIELGLHAAISAYLKVLA